MKRCQTLFQKHRKNSLSNYYQIIKSYIWTLRTTTIDMVLI